VGIRETAASENERKSYFHDRTKNNTDFYKLLAACDGHILWKSVVTKIVQGS
jgi:hypothetical protein